MLPGRHVFLLSHMRAYTSLFGHIMGSNPAICGYYEMHIGYHSWRSFVRQKLLYFENEPPKPGYTYMFDKILHNDHDIRPAVLDSPRSRILFALRPPRETLPSILSLYRSVDPGHAFNSADFATRYYIDRLGELERLAGSMQRDYLYFDAPALVDNTDQCLRTISEWLGLDRPLSREYDLQAKTSAERYGDSSERISSGRITTRTGGAGAETVDAALVEEATSAWKRTRERILEGSGQHCLSGACTADSGGAG